MGQRASAGAVFMVKVFFTLMAAPLLFASCASPLVLIGNVPGQTLGVAGDLGSKHFRPIPRPAEISQ